MDSRPTVTFILGCTGSGKGALGRALATRVNAEIISVDSMKVYRRMDIGTAKPTAAHRAEVAHHLIDVAEPSEEFSVARYAELADAAIRDIIARGKHALAVGGTALYVKTLSEGLFEGPSADPAIRERLNARAETEGLDVLHAELRGVDPEAGERIHPNDRRRIVRALEVYELTGKPITSHQTQWDSQNGPYRCVYIGLRREREDQSRRTNARVMRMIEQGLLGEVRSLLAEPAPLSTTARQAVGYAEMITHLQGDMTLEEAIEKIKINTRRLSKAQRTWFKRFRDAVWVDLNPDDTATEIADRLAQREDMPWSNGPN